MRLVFLTPTLDRSGAEKQLTLLATGLKRRTDWDLHVVALTRGGPYEQPLRDAGIPVTVLGKRAKFDPISYWRLKRLLGQLQPDLLHTWMFTANAYGRLAAGRRPAYPVVVSERCVDSWKSGWQLRLDRWLRPGTARLLANSQAVADFYHEQGYSADLTTVIPNGVELPARDETLRARLKEEWDVPPEGRVVGYLGRLARQKRLPDLIWGFQLFRQLTHDVYFVIAGDGPERSDLEEYAAQMNCAHLIRFVGHRDEGAAVLQAVDLFWLGSDFEGMSNSLMEAMAAGIPCVASDIPANRELVVPGVTGELAAVGDSMAFAQYSDRILNDPERYAAMSQAARARMADEFSIDRMIDRHLELYQNVTAGDASTAAQRTEG